MTIAQILITVKKNKTTNGSLVKVVYIKSIYMLNS